MHDLKKLNEYALIERLEQMEPDFKLLPDETNWLKYMASMKLKGDEELQQLAESQEMIGEALVMEEYFKLDPETRFRYMQAELEKYLAPKREEYFIRKGELKGLQEGEKKGILAGIYQVAKNMLTEGMPIIDIKKMTNLSEKEILSLQI